MIGLAAAVTPAKQVTQAVADAASDIASDAAASWLASNPQWALPVALALFVLGMAAAWLKGKAAATSNKVDDVAADALADTIEKTKKKTKKGSGK